MHLTQARIPSTNTRPLTPALRPRARGEGRRSARQSNAAAPPSPRAGRGGQDVPRNRMLFETRRRPREKSPIGTV